MEVQSSLEVATPTSGLVTLGPQLTPLKCLAQNSQGSIQSLSLVWQKAQLGSSPYFWRTGKIWQLILRGSPAGGRERWDEGEGMVGRTQ